MIKRYRSMYINGLRRRANWVEKHPWLIVLPLLGAALRTHRMWYGRPAKDPEFPGYKAWMDRHVFGPVRSWLKSKQADRAAGSAPVTNREETLARVRQRLDSIDTDSPIPDHIRERLQRVYDKAPRGVPDDIIESLGDLLRPKTTY